MSHLFKDSEILNKQTKPKLVERLLVALIALQLAESCMKKQSDVTLKSMDELMKRTELTRTLVENTKIDSPIESLFRKQSYAEAVQLSPIILKPTSNQTLSRDQINEKMSQALDKLKWLVSKGTENGNRTKKMKVKSKKH